MKGLLRFHNQNGFTLVQAIFVVVVLALLGVVMMRLAGVQSTTSLFALQGARAYQAARSGLEWGAERARAGNSCSGTMTLDDFTVTVSCSGTNFTEGASTYAVYRINSAASFGVYGSPDYVQRSLEMKVKVP